MLEFLEIQAFQFEDTEFQANDSLEDLLESRLTKKSVMVPWDRLSLSHLTLFQRTVLHQLNEIPRGDTMSYGELAESIDRTGAARAVGQALKQNPYPVLLPCHRIIRSDGTLGGYGGTYRSPVKRRLLDIEGVRINRSTTTPK